MIGQSRLMWHPELLGKWLQDGCVSPVYIEVGLTDACNLRCSFCSFSYLKRKEFHYLDVDLLTQSLEAARKNGAKAVMLAGEGEPTLHPDIDQTVFLAREMGFDMAITTNGLSKSAHLPDLVRWLSWLRFSVNAGNPVAYAKIHGCRPSAFDRLLDNITLCVVAKRKAELSCEISVQAVLLDENEQDMVALARRVKEIGMDTFTVKPFTPHPKRPENSQTVVPSIELEWNLKALETADFQTSCRPENFRAVQEARPYNVCHALDFMAVIASDGEVYACANFLGDKGYSYGNINEALLSAIWASRRKTEIQQRVNASGLVGCRLNCRLDSANRYLETLKHPPRGVNFV